MEFSYRVTKYDPANRNKVGHYKQEEWTSVNDIGTKYGEDFFKIEEYLKVEKAYVNAIENFMKDGEIPYLKVASLNKWTRMLKKGKLKRYYSKIMKKNFSKIREGDLFYLDEIKSIVPLILRQNLWCKLEFQNQFFVHFGYDYYMYIGTYKEYSSDICTSDDVDIYIEPYISPYLD
ncbi:hypothetical protein [Saccharibacillus sp. JS10]|uniref:hypothetical protein n=1 Tax=Saccharibacillus sp. JS10 TaxID=2950552 RepID=UPI002109F0C9|nr:hypothetical protein [Saccharibacillus sp. JS10]MCQ4087547.1 hypothetical protein [Saccharibacillus sp. JS10]